MELVSLDFWGYATLAGLLKVSGCSVSYIPCGLPWEFPKKPSIVRGLHWKLQILLSLTSGVTCLQSAGWYRIPADNWYLALCCLLRLRIRDEYPAIHTRCFWLAGWGFCTLYLILQRYRGSFLHKSVCRWLPEWLCRRNHGIVCWCLLFLFRNWKMPDSGWHKRSSIN